MTKPDLMKKLEAIVEEFARNRSWGSVEIGFSDGAPTLLRVETTQKLAQESNRATNGYRH